MIVTFIYKIKNSEKYYGKYIGHLSTDYEEGLDKELIQKLYNIFEKHYFTTSSDDIVLGIIGFNRDTYDYFSDNESRIFDILYCNWTNQEEEVYINGKLVK